MPYKDKNESRAAWRRWYKKHNLHAAVRKKRKSRDIARWMGLNRKTCSSRDCFEIGERHHPNYDNAREFIWLCKKHHEMVHHPTKRYCHLPGCSRIHQAKGLCNLHYKRWVRGNL